MIPDVHLEAGMPPVIEVPEPQIEKNRADHGKMPRERVAWPVSSTDRRLPAQREQPLFSDCLVESSKVERGRRWFATAVSIVFQSLLIGTMLIVPLLFTEALPKQQLLTFLVAPPPPPPPPPPPAAPAAARVHQIQSDLIGGQLRTPTRIPSKVQMIHEEEAPPPEMGTGGVVGGVPGGIPGGQLGGVIGGIVSQTSNLNAIPKLSFPTPPAPKRVRISQGVTKGLLLTRIEPSYPVLARAARIQGEVVLAAIISKDGTIKNLTLVSGHPMLVPAAIEAVSQWRYRPYLLNGEPVEVESTITVTFVLSQ
jgi:periplasmic protein TonB